MEGNFGRTEQIVWTVLVFTGIIMCKIVYEVIGKVSSLYFKDYVNLTKSKRIEWNARGVSTFHLIIVAAVSFYLLVLSDTFADDSPDASVVHSKSTLSDAMFGISLGYFFSDLGMILWVYPSLGGKEYIFHHVLSIYSICLSMISGKAHIYIIMVLFGEITTPCVNMLWYLNVSGQKSSMPFIYSGVALFLGWLVTRIFMFIYLFIHMYLHFDQVKMIFPLGFYSVLASISILTVLNGFWFWKICKGMVKVLSRKKHAQ